MNRIILYADSRILLSQWPDGSFTLPCEGDFPPDYAGALAADSAGTFAFDGYVAVPLAAIAGRLDTLLASGYSRHEGSRLSFQLVGLRESWQLLPDEQYRAAAKGAELLNWSAATRYCSSCGRPLERASAISKRCPGCSREVFPALWPAIVVLVLKQSPDGDPAKEEALLVHARNLARPNVQTLVAGFVETGESLEECVAREVKEETSLEIDGIRYVGSQSWPFPHQLMLGFIARYRSGSIRFADGELTAGAFFSRANLPELPTLPSLSRRIIDAWEAGRLDSENGKV